tara:strand:+ start:8627 stop:8941 length:315 start_codon:yes stop_codon:yes gene_type:complete
VKNQTFKNQNQNQNQSQSQNQNQNQSQSQSQKNNNTLKKLLLLFIPIVFFCGCEEEECVAELIPDCFYLMVYDPVCGCDGITYGNSGEAACNHILEYTEGECLN